MAAREGTRSHRHIAVSQSFVQADVARYLSSETVAPSAAVSVGAGAAGDGDEHAPA
jgi:hypothetical protein